MKLDARQTLFVTVVATFVVCLVVGNLIGGKVTSLDALGREWPFSVGQLAFPVTFILTDILNEFYGRQVTRRVTLLAFVMTGLSFAIVYAAGAMPWAAMTQSAKWTGVKDAHFDVVFTASTTIQLASMAAFLVGNLIDISVFFVLKRATGDRFLWLRATGSTAVSQLIDTMLITALVFGKDLTPGDYAAFVGTSYAVKLTAAILVTPLIYALHALLEKRLGLKTIPTATAFASPPRADS